MSTDPTKWVAFILATLGLFSTGTCVTGCKSQAQNIDEQLQVMEARVQAAKEMGVKAQVFAVLPLRAGFSIDWSIGNDGQVVVLAEVDPNADYVRSASTSQPALQQAETDRRQTSQIGELQNELTAVREERTTQPVGP
jgi:hypothetical protein